MLYRFTNIANEKWRNSLRILQKIIIELKESSKKGKIISISKLRSMLSMLSGLYNQVVHSNEKYLDEDVQYDLKYYKVRCAYEAGRDQEVKRFIEKTHMMDCKYFH